MAFIFASPAGVKEGIAPAQFRAGQRVRHPKFGEGIVVESKLQRDDEQVTVVFEELGIKRLLASFAKLKPLQDQ